MNYRIYEIYLSKPRIDKYKIACGGDKQKAILLYLRNTDISKKFYTVLGVCLR